MNRRIRKKKLKYHFMKMKENEFLICYIPTKYGSDIKELKTIRDSLNKFSSNKYLILPSDILILKHSKEDSIKILKSVINEIEKIKNS